MTNDDRPDVRDTGGDDGDAFRDTVTTTFDWGDGPAPSTAIVEAVSDALDRPVTDLPPLHDHVDPDAVNALLTEGKGSGVSVSFEYAGAEISADSAGNVSVRRHR